MPVSASLTIKSSVSLGGGCVGGYIRYKYEYCTVVRAVPRHMVVGTVLNSNNGSCRNETRPCACILGFTLNGRAHCGECGVRPQATAPCCGGLRKSPLSSHEFSEWPEPLLCYPEQSSGPPLSRLLHRVPARCLIWAIELHTGCVGHAQCDCMLGTFL